MAYKKAPYRRSGSSWVDMNSKLEIRTDDSITATPTTKNVPVVKVKVTSGWEQIYPPQEESVAPATVVGGGLICWQGSKDDSAIWGWAYNGRTSTRTNGAQSFFGTGSYNYERGVMKEYAGFTGYTPQFLETYKKWKGLGKVISVSELVIKVKMNTGTGYPAFSRKLGIVFTNTPNPREWNGSSWANKGITPSDANNPCIARNRSSVFLSDNSQSFSTANGFNATFKFTGSSCMAAAKKFLNKDYKNIMTYTGHHDGNYTMWNSAIAGGRLLYMTKDYFKYSRIEISMKYKIQP